MNNTTDPLRPAPLRRIAILGVLFVAAIMSCGKDLTGPLGSAVRYVQGFSWSPIFPPAFQLAGGTSSGVVAFDRVHIVLHHDDGTVAIDTTVNFPAGADQLTLSLTVKLLDDAPTTGEPMSLDLGYLDATGDVVFKGGPIPVTVAPPPAGSTSNPPVQVPVTYTGPGSNAFAVVISPRSTTAVSGAGFSFSAVAIDINHTPIAGTPIVWSSLDPNVATITSGLAGSGIAQNQRGPAHIVAQLLTGQADTVIVNVTLPASLIVPQSGNTQTGVVGAQLAQPLVVKVSAADGLAVAGTTVNFAVASGGGSVVNSSVVSDANGLAQTKWTLGTAAGTQTVTASSGTLTNSPLTFTATANPVTATKLVNTTPPTNGLAGTPLGPIVFTAEDNNGNVATGFNGQIIVSLSTTIAGATLSGTTSVTASAGVAAFSTLAINKNGAGYTLVAASSLPSDTTAAFNIGVGAPAKLVFTVQPTNTTTGLVINPAIVVNAEDAQGNLTPSFTGAVTLSFATNPSSANLGGTVTVNAILGVATFTGMSVSAAGAGYSLSAEATGLTSATSSLFNVASTVAGPATQLAITTQPANTTAGVAIAPAIVVTARDVSNNLATTFSGNVMLAFGANPGGSTLGGTVTATAAAGIATFSTINLNKSGVGYTLVASSGTLGPATTSTFNITAAAASTLGVTAGNGQSGAASGTLATPLGVTILDAFGNAVSGATVNWATPNGGSFSPVSSATNAAGIATSVWTLGAAAGPQTATATSGTLTGSPGAFTATATVAGFSKTWTGATSTAWATATNWAPSGAPVTGDSVNIPLTANQPTLNAGVSLKHLTLGAGAILTLASSPTLAITGNLNVGGAIAGAGLVTLSGTGTVGGTIAPNVSVVGTYVASSGVTLAGNLTVTGSLDLSAQTVTITGAFQTASSGTIKMISGSTLTVAGDVTFSGGSETGLITAGTITTAGTFTQSGASTTSFVGTGTNSVHLVSSVAKTLSIANPGTATFSNLLVANTAGVTLQTDFTVTNLMIVSAGTATGAGIATIAALQDVAGGLNEATIIFNGSPNPLPSTTVVTGNITFSNNPTLLTANVTVNGNVRVTGNLQLNTHFLSVNGSFRTTGSGQLTMTNASDSMSVSGNASFNGGVEAGILTNGKLMVAGNFGQVAGSGGGQEFKATSPHLTVLTGGGAQTITFANPDTTATVCSLSCFGDFTIAKSGGTVKFTSPAGANGGVTVNAGVTAVTAIDSLSTGSRFLLVRGATTTAAGTGVHISRFGTYGSLALDPSTEADTVQFHGTAAQTIPSMEFGGYVVIKGSPAVGTGGFTVDSSLTVDGGSLILGGNGVGVYGGFLTTNGGTLVMNQPHDSLLVVGQATFAGGVEAGKLTDGTLFLFQGIAVSAAGQFNATGNHVTYLYGPTVGCGCTDILAPGGRTGVVSMSMKPQHRGRLSATELAARSAAVKLEAKAARAKAAKIQAARKVLAAKWPSRANAMRAAAAAGRTARTPRVGQRPAASIMATNTRLGNIRLAPPGGRAGRVSAQIIPVQPYSEVAVAVAFADSTGNQFANVRIAGQADWQTFARAAGNVQLDGQTDVEGNGHMAINGSLTGPSNTTIASLEAVEIGGILADSGSYSPDTTVFSGAASQTIPTQVGYTGYPSYNHVVVNSPLLFVQSESSELDIGGSLFILNSGRLWIGVADTACTDSCDADEVIVTGGIETHGAGTLRMDDASFEPFLAVYGNALFAGGSTSGLLTQGEVHFYSNFQQLSTTSTSAYAATGPHETHFDDDTLVQHTVSFANPSFATSHFGDLYFGDTLTVLQSNIFASGELETGMVTTHRILSSPTGFGVTSKGADVRDATFDGTLWTLVDGDSVTDMDVVNFINMPPTATQFTVQRTNVIPFSVSLSNWYFATTPTGGGLYINATDTDGATNGLLTINMSGTSPSLSNGFVSTSGGAVINGWPATVVDNWLGNTSVWNSTANWSTGQVPTSTTDVAIFCDCNSPITNVAAAVHNLTISGSGQLTLGSSSPLTVYGNLSVGSGLEIDVSSASLTLLGNVTMDPTASPAGVYCGSGSTGAILSGTGTQSVTGKFCRLAVNSSVMAAGTILVGSTTSGYAGLTVGTGGNINFNGHRVETDSMYTTGTGTITMQNSRDSLVLHGANVGIPVYFNGGSTSGLITNGTIVDHSPHFQANGTAFDAAGGSNIIIADSTSFQGFKWIGATLGHGINNLIATNTSKMFSSDLVITGTLTLDASMTTSGQFQATAFNLYVGQAIDNTGNVNGALCCSYWLHMTGDGAMPAIIGTDSLFFQSGGTMSLANNVSAKVSVVKDNVSGTALTLNGHTLTTNNFNFLTTGASLLQMTSAGDSLALGTGSAYFNGGGTTGTLTAGGIAAAGFYQGYQSTTLTAAGAAVNSYDASGTHRLWLSGSNAPVIFANPGTATLSSSHFNSFHTPVAQTAKLYSDIFINDSLYLGTATALSSDQVSTAGKTRFVTAAGLADQSGTVQFVNVGLKWVDGQPAPAHFDNVQWTGFPVFFTAGRRSP